MMLVGAPDSDLFLCDKSLFVRAYLTPFTYLHVDLAKSLRYRFRGVLIYLRDSLVVVCTDRDSSSLHPCAQSSS